MIFIYSIFLLDILFINLLFLVIVIIYLLFYHWISILFNKHTSPQKNGKIEYCTSREEEHWLLVLQSRRLRMP